MKFKNITAICLAVLLLMLSCLPVLATDGVAPIDAVVTEISTDAAITLDCTSAVLMDAATGEILVAKNENEALPPASVTKIMTLLLVMEAVDAGRVALTDTVTVSERAAAMGGSQVFLKVGEQMSLEEMLKCVIIASANDCAVALAEHVAGSETAFVGLMNKRAAELGMANTHFENTNGLDDTVTNHVTSALDIALMSRALIAHPKILEYSGIWQDTIRDGAFGLTNTNRLVRFYRGCTGLKTGSTARAKFCMSATAERDGVSLIAVIMGAPSRDARNNAAAALLDYGFANYTTVKRAGETLEMPVLGGVADSVKVSYPDFLKTLPKGADTRIEKKMEMESAITAPIKKGDTVGRVLYTLDGETIGEVPVTATADVAKIGFGTLFKRLLCAFLLR